MIADGLWRLPGPSSFLNQLEAAVSQGSSCVLVMPRAAPPPEFSRALSAALGHTGQAVYETTPEDLWRQGRAPLHMIAERRGKGLPHLLDLRFTPGSPIDAAGLVRRRPRARGRTHRRNAPLDRGPDRVNRSDEALAAANKSYAPDTRLPAITIVDDPREALRTANDVTLQVHWWWGVLGRLDAQVQASLLGIADPIQRGALTELAGWDLSLLADLAAASPGVEDVESVVPRAAEDSVVTTDVEDQPARDRPPEMLLDGWSRGQIQRWRDGFESTPACSQRNDPTCSADAVRMAQVARIFPEIEMERGRLAQALRSEAAWRGLPRELLTDAGRVVPVEELEIGALNAYAAAHPGLQLSEARRRSLRILRDARNTLAHLDPLSPTAVARLRSVLAAERAAGP